MRTALLNMAIITGFCVLSVSCVEADERHPATAADLRSLKRSCEEQSTAQDALSIIRTFQLRSSIPRELNEEWSQLEMLWRERASADLVRLGRRWVTRQELQEADEAEESLRTQALSLIKLKDFEGGRRFLEEAAEINPNRFLAHYCLGIHYLMHHDLDAAIRSFQRVRRIAPKHVGALNNLAVAYVKDGDIRRSLPLWVEAAEIAPDNVSVMHNAGRLIREASLKRIRPSRSELSRLRRVFGSIAENSSVEVTTAPCWLLIPPLAPADQQAEASAGVVDGNRRISVGGSGTGFVVFGDYVLTNRHVIEHELYGAAAGIEVLRFNENGEQQGEAVAARLFATPADTKTDLALLHCPRLNLPPLLISTDRPRLGADVMALGFPLTSDLGFGLKATRGSLSGLPSADSPYLLYDVSINPGNSGGPLVNDRSQLVAVNTAYFSIGQPVSAGVPAATVLDFLGKKLPRFSVDNRPAPQRDWQDVAASAGKSTVVIKVAYADAAPMLAEVVGRERVIDAFFVDFSCISCNGSGQTACPNRACRGGKISERYFVPHVVGSGRLRSVIQMPNVRYRDCPVCSKNAVRCPHCGGTGIARD